MDDILAESDPDEVIDMGPPASDAGIAAVQTTDVPCDAAYYRKHFFAAVDGTSYDTDEARARLVAEYSAEHWTAPDALDPDYTESLAEFLAHSTEREASAFIAHVAELRGRDLARSRPEGPAGKQRIDTSALADNNEPRPLTHAQRQVARQAAAVLDSTPFVVPGATPIDAPVIDLGATSASNGPTSASESPEPTEPESRAKTATRRELEKLWGQTWNHAARVGLKDYTKLSGLSDTELIDATTALSARIREHERNSGEVDERDLEGEPSEGPSLPLGL